MFILQHRVHPARRLACNNREGTFQVLPAEALVDQNLSYFLSFTRWVMPYFFLLISPDAPSQLIVGSTCQKVAHGHAEAVGNEICKTEYEDHACGQLSASHAGNHCERRHGPVDGSVNKVAQIAPTRPIAYSSTNCRRSVLYNQPIQRRAWHKVSPALLNRT
jgi:hypothetical protein